MAEKNNTPRKAAVGITNDFSTTIMQQARDIILVTARDGTIMDANQAASAAYGYSLDELRKLSVYDLRSAEVRMVVDAQLDRAQKQGTLFRTVHIRRNGEHFPVEVSSQRVQASEGEAVVSIVRDITEAIASEAETLQKNMVLTSLHETTMGLMKSLDMNTVLTAIVSRATELIGTAHGFISIVDEKQGYFERKIGLGHYVQDVGRKIGLTEGFSGQVYKTGEITIVDDYSTSQHRLSGSFFDRVYQVAWVPLKQENKVLGVFGLSFLEPTRTFSKQEISLLVQFAELASIALVNAHLHHSLIESEKKLQKSNEEITAMYEELLASDEELKQQFDELLTKEESIRRLAYYDTLTGLPNRVYLHERLTQELEKAKRGEATGAVLFIDMDDLKMINDTLGHSCGDSVIVTAGACILAASGEQSVVARVGGDEFIVLLPNESNQQRVGCVADTLIKLLSRNYEIGESSIHMSASIGITGYPSDGITTEDILKSADLALYAAKGSGKNTWRFYETRLQTMAYETMTLKHGLRKAIEREELSLHYQPIVNAQSGRVASFEALLRWTSLAHGSVPPSRFIPLAEESDIIQKIGKWVVKEACRFAHKLAEMGKDDIRVSVNVSSRQLVADDFVTIVREAIDSAKITPDQLEIEITESALIASFEDSNQKLQALRDIGVQLSLDDFGTGFSSLTYLRSLPVETLKIDKTFIDEIVSDPVQLQFISSIVNMAHVLRLTVVAEGVETEEQLQALIRSQCDFIQGYIVSRPVPEKEAILFLDRPTMATVG